MAIFRDLSKTRTEELLDLVKTLHQISWATAGLAGLCLGILALKEESLERNDILVLGSIILLFVITAAASYWWLSKRVLPILQKRCSELPIPESNVSCVAEFQRNQRWSKFGKVLVLMFIPVAIFSNLNGYPVERDGSITLVGWVLILAFTAPALFLIFRGAQCPSCKMIILRRNQKDKVCSYCGARLR